MFILEVKVRTLHLRFSKLLLLLKKTVMVFQCMFVKWLSKSRRQSQKETSLPIDSVSRKNGKVFTFTGIPWRNFALKCLQSFWLHLRENIKKALIDLYLSFLGQCIQFILSFLFRFLIQTYFRVTWFISSTSFFLRILIRFYKTVLFHFLCLDEFYSSYSCT